MINYTPHDFNKIFPPTPTPLEKYFNDLYERCSKMYNWSDNGKQISYQEAKLKLNSLYGRLAMPEKENNMRDKVIVLHSHGKPFIVVKEMITAIREIEEDDKYTVSFKCCVYLSGGTILTADETYSEVVKRYFS